MSVCCGTQSGTLCRSGPCILQYLWWYVGPISFLDSSIFMVIRYANLVPVFFDTYSGTLGRSRFWILRYLQWYAAPIWFWRFFDICRNILYQSNISGQDAQSASVPRMFFPVGRKRQPEEGGIGPGCCGGGVITTWAAGDGVIAAGSAV